MQLIRTLNHFHAHVIHAGAPTIACARFSYEHIYLHTLIYQSTVPVRLSSVWPTPLPCNWLHLLLEEPWLKEQGLHTYFCSARLSNVCRQMACTVRRPLSHILFMHARQHLIHASARREQQRRRTHNIQTRTTQAIQHSY